MMERLLGHPTWLKLFSVAIAILIWAMVIRQYTRDESRQFEVSLQVISHPDFQLEEGPKDRERSVSVRVEGKNLAITRLKAGQITATADYSKILEPGRPQDVEIQVAGPENLKGLTYSATPRTVSVLLIKMQEALLPIYLETGPTVVTRENREWTFTARPETETVRLTGSSVLLNRVRSARVVLDDADRVPGTERVMKKVIPTDAEGKSVNLKEQQIAVLLTWKEQPPGQTFRVKATTKGALPAGLALGTIEVQPATLQVRAAALGGKLPEQAVIETEPIDLTGRTKTFTIPARVIPPPGTTVATGTVNVTVPISELIEEKILKGRPIAVRGKAGNAVATLTITDVQVRVSGTHTALTGLDAAQVSVFVDVEGLGGGKHTLPVKVEAPPGVTVLETDPTVIEVNIATP